jgi:hypothetical protein
MPATPRRWRSEARVSSVERRDGAQMAATNPIDEYLATLDEPTRATLTSVRDTLMTIVPDAEQCISYGMPAFKLRGRPSQGSRPSRATSATCRTAGR